MNKADKIKALRRYAGNLRPSIEKSPVAEFARAADLSVADAEKFARDPEGNHGVNAAKAARLVSAISAVWGDLDTFRMSNGYETFE